MSAVRTHPGRPSAAFVLNLFEEAGASVAPGFAQIVRGLDWETFADSVGAFAATIRPQSNPQALARIFRHHAETEGVGAEVIGFVASTIADERHRRTMSRHAADERRHCRIFSAMADVADGTCGISPAPSPAPDAFVDQYDGDLPSFLCDTHFAEVRNVFYLSTLSENIHHPDVLAQHKIQAGLARVIGDEKRHVLSTATILNELLSGDPLMRDRLASGLAGYAAFIREEAERAAAAS
ncbi:MAG: hypothetical protein JO013_06800 [Alphaproteobacteria bacterium]|nr:hypothetical protein [Alphaproteobacteria bacterium]